MDPKTITKTITIGMVDSKWAAKQAVTMFFIGVIVGAIIVTAVATLMP